MEKTISQEERIRRAEERYLRRQTVARAMNNNTATVNINPRRNYRLLRKIFIQIMICAGIYFAIYNMKGNNDNFSIDSINYLKNAMAYDIQIDKMLENARNYLSSFKIEEQKNEQGEQTEENGNTLEETLSATENNENTENTENTENQVQEQTQEEASSVSQVGDDATYIKNNFSLIKPATGTITSRFGLRNPTTPTVPKYHTGIDIGVPEGTVFVASMDGTVELVSDKGDYRKSYKNSKWRCNDTICTLQNNLCIRRGQNNTGTKIRRNRTDRKCNRATLTF